MFRNNEILRCVNNKGELLETGVNRKSFYNGKCANKRVCGIVFWIFDRDGNLLLTKRRETREQAPGRIAPTSCHLSYLGDDNNKKHETVEGACFREINEELGLTKTDFIFIDEGFPMGFVPLKESENCKESAKCGVIIRHFCFGLSKRGKQKVCNKDGESAEIFFEPWSVAREAFLVDDKVAGAYKFYGENKEEVISRLDKCLDLIRGKKRFSYKKVASQPTVAMLPFQK